MAPGQPLSRVVGTNMGELPLAKKALGQHWLTDIYSLQAMVAAASVQAHDKVLEIGPGTGTLTDELLNVGASVIALEFDLNRVRSLEQKYQKSTSPPVIEPGDVRTFDLNTLPADYKIVANIPYYLTSNLLRRLVDADNKPQVAALLVQKEVAERVAAGPGDMSQVTVFVQMQYEVTLGEVVPAYLFSPPPKVDSQILILTRRTKPLFDSTEALTKVIKAGFSERRKKLRSSLSGGLGISKDEADNLLKRAGISETARAQELTLEEWNQLSTAL